MGFNRQDQAAWKATSNAYGPFAAEALDYLLTIVAGANPNNVEILNPAWDLIAALVLDQPAFCPLVKKYVYVQTLPAQPFVSQGQTVAVEGVPPNAYVCLNPDLARLSTAPTDLFKQ